MIKEAWMKAPQVKMIPTDRQNRSIARNIGAAHARGEYLHFLDDDDWMLPNAFQALFVETLRAPNASWIYGAFKLVDNDGRVMKEIYPVETGNCLVQMIASEWIPLQSSWIRRAAFQKVGGFAPLDSLEGGYEDIDLSRMIARHYDFARAAEPVAVIRYGDVGSTTDYNNLVKQNRRSREKNLDSFAAFTRMKQSAKYVSAHQGYWHGRILYYYLVSIIWNLKNRSFQKAVSRFLYAVLALTLSGSYLFLPEYWRSLRSPHFNRVRKELGDMDDKLYAQTVWNR